LTTIVSSLTPEDEGTRHSSIESIVLAGVDVSDFFARHRFPKLRHLSLSRRFVIWDWDFLKRNTTALINLSLSLNSPISIPSTSQILSLLASNPNIRTLVLELLKVKDDSGGGSEFRVPLQHLEKLSLKGEFHCVFPILHRLELPERVDHARLDFYNCIPHHVRETIGPYIRDYLQRDPRFEGRLGIFASSTDGCISLQASVIGVGYHGPDRLPQQGPPYAMFLVTLPAYIPSDEKEKLCTDVLAFLPQESIVYFKTNGIQ
jgi:hypothetical protein